jgi:hypothetical protein
MTTATDMNTDFFSVDVSLLGRGRRWLRKQCNNEWLLLRFGVVPLHDPLQQSVAKPLPFQPQFPSHQLNMRKYHDLCSEALHRMKLIISLEDLLFVA